MLHSPGNQFSVKTVEKKFGYFDDDCKSKLINQCNTRGRTSMMMMMMMIIIIIIIIRIFISKRRFKLALNIYVIFSAKVR